MKTDDALENVAKRSKFSETCIFLIHNSYKIYESVAKQKLTSCMIQKEMLITW